MTDVRITPSATGKRLLVHSPYNAYFVSDIKQIGGRWDGAKKAWSVDARDEDRVKELLLAHYGTDGSPDTPTEVVNVRIRLRQHELTYHQGAKAMYAGRIIAERQWRDAPVRLAKGVILIEGELPASGGSKKYPEIDAGEDVILEVRDVPRAAVDNEGGWREIVGESTIEPASETVENLLARRAELMAQVAELDAKLGEMDPEGTAERKKIKENGDLVAMQRRLDREHRKDKAEAIAAFIRDQRDAERDREEQADRDREAVKALPLGCRCGKHTCAPQGASPREYAALVGKAPSTILSWCRTGKIPAVQHGGRWYVVEPTDR